MWCKILGGVSRQACYLIALTVSAPPFFGAMLKKDLETRVDAENEKRTVQTVKNIEKMDLEQFEKHIDAIDQVMSDNVAQGRALELMGANGQVRFRDLFP